MLFQYIVEIIKKKLKTICLRCFVLISFRVTTAGWEVNYMYIFYNEIISALLKSVQPRNLSLVTSSFFKHITAWYYLDYYSFSNNL